MYYPVFIVIGILFCIWFLLPFFTKRILNPGNITGISFSVLMHPKKYCPYILSAFLPVMRAFFHHAHLFRDV